MKFFYEKPLDQSLATLWKSVSSEYKRAFFAVLGINLLAFAFEATNLTLHHDDVAHIFIQDSILGHYLGRFGFGWLHYLTQNAYIMPFLQMAEATVLMSVYGLLVSHFWGARNVLDIILISAIICVFPYMAQIHQYNACMYPFAMAHLLAASAVILSTRATVIHTLTAALLYTAAFSIYQSVIANAATIFSIWLLTKLLFTKDASPPFSREIIKSVSTAILSVTAGGLIYLAIVSALDLEFDSYQAAGEAFNLSDGINLAYALSEIMQGTRSFLLWPENYFPDYLKKLQLVFIAGAGIFCLLLPKSLGGKVGAVLLLVSATFSPRLLQLIHPAGTYHHLTLTGYALVIAGAVLIINRAGRAVAIRNISIILAFFLIAGYIMQCNWISTVNHLNTLAHYTTLTQVLARVRSLPDKDWDGKKIAVVGTYNMSSDYPFKLASGVAVKYMDAIHMQHLANLMRDDVTFVEADSTMPEVLEYTASHAAWPNPASVGVVNGVGVVVLSKSEARPD